MRIYAVLVLWACAGVAHAASYSTYIGDAYQYQVSALATDTAGNSYLTGSRIVVPASTVNTGPITDVFVSKLDATGNLTVLATVSGKGSDQANGIAVDSSGNIYVVGYTTSADFPLRNPLQSVPFTGLAGTAFLMKLAADGSVIYSTFLGGTLGASSLAGVAADAQGNAYVTGWTTATDYQHTPGLPAGPVFDTPDEVVYGAFFAKINPTGSQILYAGALSGGATCGALCQGGFISNMGTAMAVDPAGNAYIAGNAGAGLPSTSGTLLVAGIGAFVAKVNPAGTGLVYLTYLGAGNAQPVGGASPTDSAFAITADAAGDAYISGSTSDPSFPVTSGAFQTKLASTATPPSFGPPDAFVAKLNPTGSAMVWATYLGGTQMDSAQTVALDSAGDVWVSGTTQSTDFPTTVSVSPGGSEFLAELNSTGTTLIYSALFPTYTVAQALAVDSSNMVHAAGDTGLVSSFAVSAPPGQTSAPWMFGLTNAAGGLLLGRLAPGELIAIYGLNLGPAVPAFGSFDTAGFLPTTLGGVQVTINGTPAPLLYVSETQINAVAPVELTAGSSAELQLTQNNTPLPDFEVRVDIAAPGVFQSPNGGAAAINQDGTVNSQANPAPDGSYVSIWTTGTGYFPGSDGQMAAAADQFCASGLLLCGILESSGIPSASPTPVTVSYSGAAPGDVNGVVQINFQVSTSAQFGYYLSVNGINSNTFTIYTTSGNSALAPSGFSRR
ncbi:MAG TPA: SBBP repeat-containing protein [Bryobacteraceae bacterium]|jgi:uncharacterized protein (TIGR03437 family)|nr:SBBP repeat-containing protein [Bryobacteraceae bacterium]